METLILNKSEVGSLIDLDKILEAVEGGYRSFSLGQVVQPPFMSIVKPGTHSGFDFKGGLDLGGGWISMKASSGGYPDNPKLGLPTGMNTVLLFEADTSALKCIMDGTWITGCRTAAAGAISVKHLARASVDTIAVMGTGNQARRQLRAIVRVRSFKRAFVWGYTYEKAAEYAREMSEELGIKITPVREAELAVRAADVVVTTTRARRGACVKREWLRPGTHVAAIGADMPDKQELEADVLAGAKVVCDSISICAKNGELHHAIEAGLMTESDVHAEIGEILLGKKPARENDDEITIFDTVGMAIQDNVMAADIYRAAAEKGIGIKIDLLR